MANFPASVSTNANLYISVNGLQTTLAVACNNSVTTLTLTSTTGFPTTGLVTIDNTEIVSYTGVSGATITGCTRGADGTTAASHPIGVTVGLTVVAAHHNLLKDEVIAIETALGAGFTTAVGSVTGTTDQISSTGGNTPVLSIPTSFPLYKYRRPNLTFVNTTTVAVELGLDGTSGDASVLFPDGQLRTEVTANLYSISTGQNAVFTHATRLSNQGGIRSGAVVNNTWYACYAVKVTTFAADWVLVADTVLPLQANYATLNSNFGTNSWVYMGLIRYGDNGSNPSNVLDFLQTGNITRFRSIISGHHVGFQNPGWVLAGTAGASSLTWTYAAGTAGVVIPNNIAFVDAMCLLGGTTGNWSITDSGVAFYAASGAITGAMMVHVMGWTASFGLKINPPGSVAMDICLRGFADVALGIGSNPLL